MINIPFTKVQPALIMRNRTYAKSAPRCKNCDEVQANHLPEGNCLFAPLSWDEAPPNIEEVPMECLPYQNDIRKILSDNSLKDMMEHEDQMDALAYALGQVTP